VQRHWGELRAPWLAPAGLTPASAAAQAEGLVGEIDAFVHAIESQLSLLTAALTMFQFGLMALAIAGGVAMLYAAYLFVFNPLARLQQGLARLERGDLAARVAVDSRDEFGLVADGFNRMAATLEDFYRTLERKVQDKTERLRAERERLAVLYEASAFVSQASTLEALAQGFVRRLREAGRADAALLRWHDGARSEMLLLATDCVPAEMVAAETCLRPGECDCAQTGAAGGAGAPARVIPIRPAAEHARSCARFGFDHLLAVPVRLHDKLLGEADLLYRGEPRALAHEDRELLEGLAAHLAAGMESARAAALEREAAVADERSLLARELHDSIAQSLAFLKIQLQLLRDAGRRGDRASAARALDELEAGIRESTADVRELLVHFRTRTNSDDIVPALKTTLQKFQHQTGLTTRLELHGENGLPLAPDVQVQLLHVVQEALSNVRKHAGASGVWISVQQQPFWRIEVRDDGRGFAGGAVGGSGGSDETHVGLRIMRERAAAVGAEVQVDSAPGRGTRVAVQLPRPQAVAA
jgi:two-component system nitrate/nitrite sensor histidine kinase NarX